MAIPKKENHYFLPRCYLKQFSENGKFVHVYSKVHKRQNSAQGIHSVATKENFYRISLDSIQGDKKPEDVNFFENDFFGKIVESRYALLLTNIAEQAANWKRENHSLEVLSKVDRDIFAALIAIQYLRMPNIRKKYTLLQKDVSYVRLNLINAFVNQSAVNKSFIDSIKLTFSEELYPALHAEIYADQESIDLIQEHLLNKIWIFCVSPHQDFIHPTILFW